MLESTLSATDATAVTIGAFDPTLVALSFLISVFGAWCGLTCAARSRRRDGTSARVWLIAAAVSIGGGAIWSMHFIGMLAYQSDVRYTLSIPITLVSLAASILAAAIGLAIATRRRTLVGYVMGGVVTGAGVCVMHYLGMSAMQMNGMMSWRPMVVAASIVIAIVAATIALAFALNLERLWSMIGAAVVMGLGVCAMHYTGMLALMVEPHHDLSHHMNSGFDPFSLAMPIFAISAILLLGLLFAGLIDSDDDAVEQESYERV